MNNFWLAILLTTLAGSATILGSLLSLTLRRPNPKLMSAALGFAAGTMIFISFVELLAEGTGVLGFAFGNGMFLVGIIAMFAVDIAVPHTYESELVSEKSNGKISERTGLLLAAGIAIHNFPEGMATFMSTLADPALGIALASAVAIHNIPEGIAVAFPVYAATGSRRKAFTYSALSGLAEPLGALIAALVLMPFLTPNILAGSLAFVAGIMVYISMDELLPAAREFGHEHLSIMGVIGGMAIMALSLLMLR